MKKGYEPSWYKNKTVVGIICIAAALFIGFIFVPIVNNATSATVTVVRAKQDIPVGTKISDAMLEKVKVGKINLPAGASTSIDAVTGKYAAVDITHNDIITPSKTASSGSIYDLGNGQYLISITIRNFAEGLSGKLQNGDIVTVFYTESGSTQTSDAGSAAVSPPELQYVKVAAVTAASGKDTSANQLQTEASSSNNNSSNLPATVTLLVNETQAKVLAGIDKKEIHLALVCRANSTKEKALLDAQNTCFDALSAQNGTSSNSFGITSSSSASSQTSAVSQTGVVQSSSEPAIISSKPATVTVSQAQAAKEGTVSK